MPKKALLFVLLIASVFLAAHSVVRFEPQSFTGEFLAQVEGTVGIAVGIAPNQYNTLAQQLQEKQTYLNEQEAALQNSTSAAAAVGIMDDPVFLGLTAAVAVLFILVITNYYFDWRRARAERLAEAAKAAAVASPPDSQA